MRAKHTHSKSNGKANDEAHDESNRHKVEGSGTEVRNYLLIIKRQADRDANHYLDAATRSARGALGNTALLKCSCAAFIKAYIEAAEKLNVFDDDTLEFALNEYKQIVVTRAREWCSGLIRWMPLKDGGWLGLGEAGRQFIEEVSDAITLKLDEIRFGMYQVFGTGS